MYKSEYYGKGGISAKVVEHSISDSEKEIYTLELRYPRFIHSEFMTHRMFSRNASSSRAIPVKKLLKQIEELPAMPIHWGKNQPGMQADEELDDGILEWCSAATEACEYAKSFDDNGYHKQIVNRLTEPFQFISVVVTATEWDNFFKLRLHEDAQPEIYELARCMFEAMNKSSPKLLKLDEWHIPYVTDEEVVLYGSSNIAKKLSVARCARVSYLNHDKSDPDYVKDMELHDMLLNAGHMSPFEHQAKPMKNPSILDKETLSGWDSGVTHLDRMGKYWSGNFRGWIQYRNLL